MFKSWHLGFIVTAAYAISYLTLNLLSEVGYSIKKSKINGLVVGQKEAMKNIVRWTSEDSCYDFKWLPPEAGGSLIPNYWGLRKNYGFDNRADSFIDVWMVATLLKTLVRKLVDKYGRLYCQRANKAENKYHFMDLFSKRLTKH